MPARVLIVDHSRPFAHGVALRLGEEDDLEVVGTAWRSEEAEALVASSMPDVVVLECELACAHDGALARRLRRVAPGVEMVVVAPEASVPLASAAVRAGAAAFVTHDGPVDHLIDAVRSVARGEAWFPKRLLRGLVAELADTEDPRKVQHDGISLLSARELEVLECMLAGYDRATIAQKLFLSKNTVRTHVRNLLAKLGVHSSLEAISLAAQAGLTRRADPAPDSAGPSPEGRAGVRPGRSAVLWGRRRHPGAAGTCAPRHVSATMRCR